MADPLVQGFLAARKRRSVTALLPGFLPPVLAYLTVLQLLRLAAEVFFQLQAPAEPSSGNILVVLGLYIGVTLPFHRSRVVGPFWAGISRWGFLRSVGPLRATLLGLASPLPLVTLGAAGVSLVVFQDPRGAVWVGGGLCSYLLLSRVTEGIPGTVVESFWFELGTLVLGVLLFGIVKPLSFTATEGLGILVAGGLAAWGAWSLNALLKKRKRTSRPFSLALARKILPLRFWMGLYGAVAALGGLQVVKTLPLELLWGLTLTPVALGVYLLAGLDWEVQRFRGFDSHPLTLVFLLKGAWVWFLILSTGFVVLLWGGRLL